jgi:hypothetical protein
VNRIPSRPDLGAGQRKGSMEAVPAGQVADDVDATMDRVQPANGDPVVDRAVAEARPAKLPPRDGAVLALRDLGRRVQPPAAKLSLSLTLREILNLAGSVGLGHTALRAGGAGFRPPG